MSLADALAANTAGRLERMSRDDFDLIDRGIADLVAANAGADAIRAGDAAPGFALPDATGTQRSLGGFLAEGPVVLAFYRGGWCSYCNIQLRAYQKALPAIAAQGAQLIAISPEMPDESLSFTEALALAHPVLSDGGNAVARAYGLEFTVPDYLRPLYGRLGIDLERRNGDDSWRLPIPGTFVLRPDGTVAAAFVDPDYTARTDPEDVLGALAAL